MRKIINNPVFAFVLGAIIFSGVSVYATTTILSKDIKFTPENTNWEVENVEEAINDLYDASSNLNSFDHRICCLDSGGTDIYFNRALPYMTLQASGGTVSHTLRFKRASDNAVIGNIEPGKKYSVSELDGLKIELRCNSTGWQCYTITHSNQ